MNPATLLLIVKLLDILALAALKLPELKARYDATVTRIRTMIAEGRQPSDEEFAELIGECDALTSRIEAALASKPA